MVTLLDHRADWSHGVARRSSREQLRFSLSHLTNIILRISMTGRKYQFITLSVSHLTQADITQGFIVSSFISIYFWLQNNNKQSRQHPGQGPSQVWDWTEMEKVLWIVMNKNVRSWSNLVSKLLWLNVELTFNLHIDGVDHFCLVLHLPLIVNRSKGFIRGGEVWSINV